MCERHIISSRKAACILHGHRKRCTANARLIDGLRGWRVMSCFTPTIRQTPRILLIMGRMSLCYRYPFVIRAAGISYCCQSCYFIWVGQ